MKINHLAFVCKGSADWALKKKKKSIDGYRKEFEKITEIINYQIKKNIPITTFYLMSGTEEDSIVLADEIGLFLSELSKNEKIAKNKVKISVLGKWYNLPARIIDSIKKIIDDTKEYDSYFVNLCINYDGQEEIVDSCKMIARRVKLNKIEAESVTKETIKEDLYSSYFLPPDFIFVSGKKKSLYGFLLWDSVNSEIIFLNKNFPDINIKDIEKGIRN
jgi:undecaprenyl diphosphate synthase